jgi:hypothetical protein
MSSIKSQGQGQAQPVPDQGQGQFPPIQRDLKENLL